jgi:hypothetical protein
MVTCDPWLSLAITPDAVDGCSLKFASGLFIVLAAPVSARAAGALKTNTDKISAIAIMTDMGLKILVFIVSKLPAFPKTLNLSEAFQQIYRR